MANGIASVPLNELVPLVSYVAAGRDWAGGEESKKLIDPYAPMTAYLLERRAPKEGVRTGVH